MAEPRKRRGARHSISGIGAVALAKADGDEPLVAIAEWAKDAGRIELAALCIKDVVAHESTIHWCLHNLSPASPDTLIGEWTWLPASTIRGPQGHRAGWQVVAWLPGWRGI